MPCVWCLVPGSYQTTRRQRPLTAPIHDRSIAENSINLILSRHLSSMECRVTATIVNDCTIRIDDFFFDGNGIDVRIYAGLGGDYDGGFAITGDLFNFPTGYNGATVYAVLPEGRTLDDLDGISVWCVTAKVDFGSGTFAAP